MKKKKKNEKGGTIRKNYYNIITRRAQFDIAAKTS